MNILVVNGSPKGANGNTDILVQAFLCGARQAGGTAETVYLNEKSINDCTGCFACWTKTPGVCIHNDDMPELLARVRKADLLVIASPLYGNMLTGQMKRFLDRTLPLSNPAIVEIGGEYVHPPRYDDGVFRMLLISNAGFPQTHHFDGLRKTFELSTSGPRSKLAGMICCAAGPMLSIPGMKDANRWYLDAVIQAGKQVVTIGHIDQETQTTLDRSLADKPGDYAHVVNTYWDQVSVDSAPPAKLSAETTAQPIAPSQTLDSVRDLLSHLPESFSADTAGELSAVIQFAISDEVPGAYYLAIHDGICSAFEGHHAAPALTIQSPAKVWIDVCTGKQDGATALMTGKYRVTGDMSLLMRFGSLFSERRNAPA